MTSPAPFAEVIGDPIEHSLSPIIHGFWLEALGMVGGYRRHRVSRPDFPAYLGERRADPDWRGCNVTMPLKLDAIALADRSTDTALGAGAANILIPRDGALIAGNTDVGAVAILLKRLFEDGASPAPIHLLGSGGAARAALMALRMLGIADVRIHSRNRSEAIALAVKFGLRFEPQAMDSPISGAGLINATPLGMEGQPPLRVEVGGLADNGWVLDFIAVPATTPLLETARNSGLRTIDGIAILIEQAAESFRHFFDAEAPRDRDAELLQRLRR